jgi:hypothetical protein
VFVSIEKKKKLEKMLSRRIFCNAQAAAASRSSMRWFTSSPSSTTATTSTKPIALIHPEARATKTGVAPVLGGNEHLPFFIERSAFGNVPVYVDVRQNGSNVRTVLKGVRGDVNALTDALRAAMPADNAIEFKVKVSSIEFSGNVVPWLKRWLIQMGF